MVDWWHAGAESMNRALGNLRRCVWVLIDALEWLDAKLMMWED